MKLQTLILLSAVLAVALATPIRIETGTETRTVSIDLAAEPKTTCLVGQHVVDKKCKSNTDYCSTYDAVTHNCSSCKWYAFWVQNDVQFASGTKTGDYCVTRWWVWILAAIGTLLFLGILIGLCVMWCGKKKSAAYHEERVPIAQKPQQHRVDVDVQAERPSYQHSYHHAEPVRHEVVEVHGDTHIQHGERVVHEHREYLGAGDRVLVEERTRSPGREVRVVKYDNPHEDWGKYSQAHWQEHRAGHMGASTTKVVAHQGSYNPYVGHH